ncbi:nitrate- and nitrite sensing domain-containing protein [Actinoplanes sp. NPDC049265]|uniref:sensor histidine kinase n=1 Tax=Actinoplanes sp. NPDC049265 TaxID=3363902 RepID=UPI0037236E8E
MSARGRPATSSPTARSGGTIRRRIVRTLALPVAAVLGLLGVITVIEVDGYRSADSTAKAVTLVLSVQDLVQELQTERGLTAGLLGGNVSFKAELAPARQRVDDRRAAVEKLLSDGDDVEERVSSAVRKLDGLAGVRAGTDTGAAGRNPTFVFYTDRIADLTNVDFGLDASTDTELRRGVAALTALSDAKEATAQERAFLNGVFSATGFGKGEFLQFVTMRANKDAALASFDRYATATQLAARQYVFGTGAAQTAASFEQIALASGAKSYLLVNPQAWWSALTTVLDDMLRLEQHVGSVIRARAAELQDRATQRMLVLGAVALALFAGSVYLAVVASRSIAKPLATLADEANRLAGETLPASVQRATAGDPGASPPELVVPDGSSDEVRSVASALDRVQATAFALATEQASLRHSTTESLANLGRRNQNLLRRQLGFITRLEREESDPAGLANLFELDHLATRMRRNAESLLVLVGAASLRQWSEPLPIADVIRAAVSEVEEYRRVTLRRVDDTMIAGAVVSGVAHMLAELVENGLTFSPPDADVEIQGRRIGDSYLIAVTDQGIGMSPADMELANQRLHGEGDFISAPARFLGHYVVGRLGIDMGIDVQLYPSPVTGVTARITLPAHLLAEGAPAVTQTPAPLQAEVTTPAPAPAPPAPAPPPVTQQQRPDLADTQVLTLPAAPEPTTATTPDGRLRPTGVEYVTATGTPTVPAQRAASPYESAKASSSLGLDLYTFTPAPESAERTPNGLKKRTPRAKKSGSTTSPTAPAPASATRTAERPTPVVDSPADIRSRLTAFRSGVERGAGPTPPEEGSDER